ncbi:hypothetical protein [Halomicrobium urmianum]|uniref:hypothetical protein n=1 Tax=Halomicrobium urmianum TaxID=1586233 RepID=UPI001CDA07A9|nr:hypothetical protein [Halomicrobium urmianum]
MKIQKTTFTPDVGMVVEAPEQIGRKSVQRYGGGNGAVGHVAATIVGKGETTKWVVLRLDDDEGEIPEGSEVLGVDIAKDELWYMVPYGAYGGGR